MRSHFNVRSNAPSKIRQHTDRSVIPPIILSWNSLEILVQKRLPNWGELLVCYTICDSKKGSFSLNKPIGPAAWESVQGCLLYHL
jgi:hypothetical protein